MTANMQPLLIELGTDELPVKSLTALAQAFFDGVIDGLHRRGIAFDRGEAKALYSPRRLAVLLPGVATQQPEQSSEVLGPYLNIALDVDGKPTRALEGFAAKAGIDWTELGRTSDAKGERFVHRAVKPGAATATLLPEIVREAIAAMPIPKPMRWGAHDYAFARPMHWLLMLLGNDVVDGEVMGVRAGRASRGHRFMHAGDVEIATPQSYVAALRDANVLVDPDERRARIAHEAATAAKTIGGVIRVDDALLEEVNGLVEWPVAVLCAFDKGFLAVPNEALVSTMEANQKFFAVLDEQHRLTNHFVGIANIDSKDVSEVRKGYERVIRPRFADAEFFYNEDLKQGLPAMHEGLATVTYQAKLGTLADKVARVAALAARIAAHIGVDAELARRAAALSKADLQSRMVGEFPELQGIAGRYYAEHAGEPGEVAQAIDDAWMPRNASDHIAPSALGRVLAIAERLDTLAGGFAAGLKPTGNKDAFALRRNALALARTIIEGKLELDLLVLLAQAREQVMRAMSEIALRQKTAAADKAKQSGADVAASHTDVRGTVAGGVDELYDFILDRLRGYYEDRGVNSQQFDAVTALHPASLGDLDARLQAIGEFVKLPEAEALASANKRIRNILRKADVAIPDAVETSLLQEAAERELADAVAAASSEVDSALAGRDYVAALGRMARLRPAVDAFFDQVMVNAEDPTIRANRLALLQQLAHRLGSVAAIEHLAL